MAAYRPELNEAQDVVLCKYCEQSSDELYHCTDCGDNMCPKCHKDHINHSSFAKHKTVPYNEREFAGVPCMEHSTQFYDAGCKDCSIPICPECKLKYHKTHKNTSIVKVCNSARKNVETKLKRMEVRQCRVSSYIDEGTRSGKDFKQIKEKLESRALELKSYVDILLSKSLAEVKRLEEAQETSVHKYVDNLKKERDDLEEKIQICKQHLISTGPIELAFYEEKFMNWNQTDALKGLKIPRFISNPLKESEMISLFGYLSFEEISVGERDNLLVNRPRTAASRKLRLEHQPTRIPQTDRIERRRANSAACVSLGNMKRFGMKKYISESPNQIKEFKSCLNILFQITYSEQLSRLFISGDKPLIYTYTLKFLGVSIVESKLEELAVSKEPQGLAIGLTGNLVYSDGFNGVVEVESNVINAIQRPSFKNIQRDGRIIFNKEGYTTWGVHCTKFGVFLICIVPNSDNNNYAAVVKITLDNTHLSKCEYRHKSNGEPLFSNPRFVCENIVTGDICVSDFDNKVIVLSISGDFRFSYPGNLSAIQKPKTFAPRGIACTSQGHILVADVENNLVHMLQSNAQFITHILSSGTISPIFRPWGICVDSKDRIWLVEEHKNEGAVKCLAKVKVFEIYQNGS